MYIIYNKQTTETIKKLVSNRAWFTHEFETRQGAKNYLTRQVNQGKLIREDYAIADIIAFTNHIEKQETKRNILSGKNFKQSVNTPLCCDPSSETYWSM